MTAKKRHYQDTQTPTRQDGVLKTQDDEFLFRKDPPDLQPFLEYRALAVLTDDSASANDSDLEFGAELDVEIYRTLTVAWILSDTAANSAAGILVPQVQLKDQEGDDTWGTVWFAPAVVDSTLAAGLNPSYDYREVNPAEFRMAFERPSGEVAGATQVRTVLQFDVTRYAKCRLGVGVDTGSTGMLHGLLTSLQR